MVIVKEPPEDGDDHEGEEIDRPVHARVSPLMFISSSFAKPRFLVRPGWLRAQR